MMTKSSDIFPADAEVREAVEHLERSKGFYSRAEHLSVFVRSIDTLLSYVRAAQAPRLARRQAALQVWARRTPRSRLRR